MITGWVLYMSPLAETSELILKDAAKAEGQGKKAYVDERRPTANSLYLYPDQGFLSRTSFGFSDPTDEAAEEWDAIFEAVLYG